MSNNPYLPPSAFSETTPSNYPQSAPTAATVFGVLHLIFGVLGLCGTTMSGAILFFPLDPQLTKDSPAFALMEENAVYRYFLLISVLLGFVACVVLIIAGAGLLQVQKYGRNLSIIYGVYAIAMNVVGTLFNVFLLFPRLLEQATAAGGNGPQAFAAYMGIFSGTVGVFIGLLYPGLLLYFMYRPHVVAAFKTA